jgi:hypothetical protein
MHTVQLHNTPCICSIVETASSHITVEPCGASSSSCSPRCQTLAKGHAISRRKDSHSSYLIALELWLEKRRIIYVWTHYTSNLSLTALSVNRVFCAWFGVMILSSQNSRLISMSLCDVLQIVSRCTQIFSRCCAPTYTPPPATGLIELQLLQIYPFDITNGEVFLQLFLDPRVEVLFI